jgi:hypothetical protein
MEMICSRRKKIVPGFDEERSDSADATDQDVPEKVKGFWRSGFDRMVERTCRKEAYRGKNPTSTPNRNFPSVKKTSPANRRT